MRTRPKSEVQWHGILTRTASGIPFGAWEAAVCDNDFYAKIYTCSARPFQVSSLNVVCFEFYVVCGQHTLCILPDSLGTSFKNLLIFS